ncbi:hypothetical protein ONZ45_g8981 [Pleurotus djamor]|nr:hypothetical protein ONZ45_g8981 [Pleurotus djamor]
MADLDSTPFPASPASFTSPSSSPSSPSSTASDWQCSSVSSIDSGYPSPHLLLTPDSRLTESPATSPEVSCTPKPLLTPPHTRTIRRSLSRPSSSVGLPAFVNNMTFGFKDKDRSKPKTPKKSQTSDPSTSSTPFPSSESIDTSHSTPSTSRTARFVSATLGRAKLQKKKSLASFLNAVNQEAPSSINDSSPSTPSSSSLGPPASERGVARKVAFEEDASGEVIEKFEARDRLTRRHGMSVHSYGSDVPYMQSYDRMALDNDYYTEQLINKLNTGNSPTFHQYGKKPPTTVLDLGCGRGTWVCQAADAWKTNGTIVTGFDIVNLSKPFISEYDNARFVQGDFVKYALPFKDESFDLVRMANLSLCIPYEKWPFVFSEVKRVLTPKGRLELIDDQIFFPYGSSPSPIEGADNVMSPTTPTPKSHSRAHRSAFEDDDEEPQRSSQDEDASRAESEARSSYEEDESFDSASTLIDSDASTLISARSSMQSEHSVFKKHIETSVTQPPQIELPAFAPIDPISFDLSDALSAFPPPPTRPIPNIPVPSTLSPNATITPLSACADATPQPTSTSVPSDTSTPTQRPVESNDLDQDGELASSGAPTANPESLHDEYATWEQCSEASKDLEIVFEKMLQEKYMVHPRPHDFIFAALKATFGDDSAEKVRSMHIRLAPPECNYEHELGVVDEGDADVESKKSSSVTIRWEKKSKKERKAAKESAKFASMQEDASLLNDGEAFIPPPLPEGLSAKAAKSLGISPSDFASAAAASVPSSPRPPSMDSSPSSTSTFIGSGPVQSPGLIVLPSTFIPLSPAELEMHACKHIHTLLGCKPALQDFVGGFQNGNGQRMCDDAEFEESLWQYEWYVSHSLLFMRIQVTYASDPTSFRRQRFNWPSGSPDSDFDTSCDFDWTKVDVARPTKTRPRSSSSLSGFTHQTSYAADELTHVRTLRVFGATKNSDAIAPILMRSHSGLQPSVSKKVPV